MENCKIVINKIGCLLEVNSGGAINTIQLAETTYKQKNQGIFISDSDGNKASFYINEHFTLKVEGVIVNVSSPDNFINLLNGWISDCSNSNSGGGSGDNFSNSDLTFAANRTHNLNGKNLEIKNDTDLPVPPGATFEASTINKLGFFEPFNSDNANRTHLGSYMKLNDGSNVYYSFNGVLNNNDVFIPVPIMISEADGETSGVISSLGKVTMFATDSTIENYMVDSDIDPRTQYTEIEASKEGALFDNGEGKYEFKNLLSYADEAAATLAGVLGQGQIYQTDGTGAAPLNVAGILMVKQ
jgi:hypothetical protein